MAPTDPVYQDAFQVLTVTGGQAHVFFAMSRALGVLERVHAGELSNAQAAAELGITYAAWSAWKAKYGWRDGLIVPAPRKVGTRAKVIDSAPTVPTAQTRKVGELVARLERVERFGAELRRRVRDLVAFVEERAPG